MVKCVAYGCKSGYKSQQRHAGYEKVSFHCVPWQNKALLAKWIEANPRMGWKPSEHSRMCSLHFTVDDFIEERTDKKTRRKRYCADQKLTNRRLKDGAVPSVFPVDSSYLRGRRSKLRMTTRAAASGRREREVRDDLSHQSSTSEDDVYSLSATAEKLHPEGTPSRGFQTIATIVTGSFSST
jgi:THAP domain-containing protein 1/3